METHKSITEVLDKANKALELHKNTKKYGIIADAYNAVVGILDVNRINDNWDNPELVDKAIRYLDWNVMSELELLVRNLKDILTLLEP